MLAMGHYIQGEPEESKTGKEIGATKRASFKNRKDRMRSQTIICLGWITVSPMVFLTGESISVARQLPQTNVATAAKLTPTLGIYLFSGQVKFQGQAPWDLKMANVPLEADPAVADYDFASFDTNSYRP